MPKTRARESFSQFKIAITFIAIVVISGSIAIFNVAQNNTDNRSQASELSVKPSISPVPSPISAPTLKPEPIPIPLPPTPPSSVLNGIQMIFSAGKGVLVTDAQAWNGKALVLKSNSTVLGTIQGPMSQLILRLKPDKCFGSPHINVKVNGQFVMDKNIDQDGYNNYASNNFSYLKFGRQYYTVEIIYNNDAAHGFCDRNLTIDRIIAQ